MRSRFAIAAALVSVACHRVPQDHVGDDAASSVAPSASAAPSAAAGEHAEHHATGFNLPCRAVAVDGDVRPIHGDLMDGGTIEPPIALQAIVPEGVWLVAGDHARLVAKDPRTTRETAFVGPARFRACVAHREESWVGAGHFDSAVGAGESPGAEEWLITPFAVIRYSAAKLHVEVAATATHIVVETGPAFVWAADDARALRRDRATPGDGGPDDATDLPWRRVGEGTMHVISTASPAARSAVDACVERARHTEELTRAMRAGAPAAGPDAGVTPGERIAEQVRARRLARASCALASVRVALSGDADTRRDLEAALGDANARWAAVPLEQP